MLLSSKFASRVPLSISHKTLQVKKSLILIGICVSLLIPASSVKAGPPPPGLEVTAAYAHERAFLHNALNSGVVGAEIAVGLPARPSQGMVTTTASYIDVTHYDPPLVPHYGAHFVGHSGSNQHYLGAGGDAATSSYDDGIANWDWYGATQYALLLPKCWLYTFACISGQRAGAWTPSNYQADMLIP